MAGVVAHHYRQAGLMADDDKAFTAHLTVAKTSAAGKRGKKRRKLKGIPKVGCTCSAGACKRLRTEGCGCSQEAYADWLDVECGSCVVDELQLCQMQGRAAGQYYPVACRVALSSTED